METRRIENSFFRDKALTATGALITISSMLFGVFVIMTNPIEFAQIYLSYILVAFVTGVAFVLVGELFVTKIKDGSYGESRKYAKEMEIWADKIAMAQEDMTTTLKEHEQSVLNGENKPSANVNLTDEEKSNLFERLAFEIKESITKNVIDEVGERQKEKIKHQDVLEFASDFRERLMSETSRLSSRANTNLFIGSITSIIGIAFLGFILIGSGEYKVTLTKQGLSVELAEYMLYHIPRLSLILFIELFSYFFLRLYKSTLEDIKYYQNELTNIDSSIVALRLALLLDNSESIQKVSNKLLETERNFVLKKGDTTVQLEVAKTQAQKSSEALKMFENLFKETKGIIFPRKSSNK